MEQQSVFPTLPHEQTSSLNDWAGENSLITIPTVSSSTNGLSQQSSAGLMHFAELQQHHQLALQQQRNSLQQHHHTAGQPSQLPLQFTQQQSTSIFDYKAKSCVTTFDYKYNIGESAHNQHVITLPSINPASMPTNLSVDHAASSVHSSMMTTSSSDLNIEGTGNTPYIFGSTLKVEKPYNCGICQKGFMHKKSLVIHQSRHSHGDTDVTKEPNAAISDLDQEPRTYMCKECSFQADRQGALNYHMRSHKTNRRFACARCDYKSSYQSYLAKHMLRHTGEKPFTCHVCAFRCNQSSNLKTHLLRHSETKPFSCDFCDFRCTLRGNLKTHVLIHTDEKPFECEICDYKCKRRDSLRTHMLTHTQEKKYVCEVCDFRFTTRSNLKTHLMTHTDKKPYSCKFCDFRCRQKGHLLKHTYQIHERKEQRSIVKEMVHASQFHFQSVNKLDSKETCDEESNSAVLDFSMNQLRNVEIQEAARSYSPVSDGYASPYSEMHAGINEQDPPATDDDSKNSPGSTEGMPLCDTNAGGRDGPGLSVQKNGRRVNTADDDHGDGSDGEGSGDSFQL